VINPPNLSMRVAGVSLRWTSMPHSIQTLSRVFGQTILISSIGTFLVLYDICRVFFRLLLSGLCLRCSGLPFNAFHTYVPRCVWSIPVTRFVRVLVPPASINFNSPNAFSTRSHTTDHYVLQFLRRFRR
jgi:hypothetical protein